MGILRQYQKMNILQLLQRVVGVLDSLDLPKIAILQRSVGVLETIFDWYRKDTISSYTTN